MSAWIGAIKDQERKSEELRRWHLHTQEQIALLWMDVWRPVVAAIKRDVAAFNREFPAEPNRHLHLEMPADTSLTVRQELQSGVVKILKIDANEHLLGLKLLYPGHQGLGSSEIDLRGLGLIMADDGSVGYAGKRGVRGIATADELAEVCLRHRRPISITRNTYRKADDPHAH